MSGATGAPAGTPTGPGGGFTQSAQPFSGLTATDLSGRRRRVGLLNTSWLLSRRKRRKGSNMRKNLAELVDTLTESMTEIAASSVDNRDALLKQSVDEFHQALLTQLAPVLPDESEPLRKGLNHIALFATTLRDAARSVEAIKTGRPGWMVGDSNGMPAETVPAAIADQLDRFIQVGVLTLRSMVNDTAELPADEDDLARAEQAGTLVKIDTYDESDELLVKSDLPEELHEYLTDPVHLVADYAMLGRSFTDDALALAEPIYKAEQLPEAFVDEFPELFDRGPLYKAEDETVGTGGDPDAANDPGDDADNEVMQDPWEVVARLSSILVVIAGSQQQAQADLDDDEDDTTGGDVSGLPDDTGATRQPLQRQAPISDIPLSKILAGEVEVDPSLADALEERETLRKSVSTLTTEQQALQANMRKMQATIDRLQMAPAAPKGAVFAVNKNQDVMPLETARRADRSEEIAKLADTDPERASLELLKVVQSGGGQPLV